MKKHYTALLAAFLITLCIGAGMALVSGSAMLNQKGLPIADTPAEATATAEYISAEQAQIAQLQKLVAEYQTRELTYQNELADAGQQLEQAKVQIQQYEMILLALQSRGIISIDPNGRVVLQ